MMLTALALLLAQEVSGSGAEGYTPPADAQPALRILGYVDLGWARAQGNGTSFAPGDTRVPADYGVDAFARVRPATAGRRSQPSYESILEQPRPRSPAASPPATKPSATCSTATPASRRLLRRRTCRGRGIRG